MAIAVELRSWVSVLDTLTGTYVSSTNNSVTTEMNSTLSYTASTTPPVTKYAAYQVTMSGGAATINLAALTNLTGDGTIDGTGLKVQAAKFRNLSTNANVMSVTEGASNGHPLLGASFLFALQPGQSLTFMNESVDVGTDIAAGDRTWDVSGTGAQILELQVVMG